MVAFYVNKIKYQEINSKTGSEWTIMDVPTLWRKKVEAIL